MSLCRDNIGDFCHGGELQDFMNDTGFSAALDALTTMPELPQDQQDVLDSLFKGKVTLEELSERIDGLMKVPNPVPELNRYLFTSFQPFRSILMNGGINQGMNERHYFRDFIAELLRGALSVHNIPYMWDENYVPAVSYRKVNDADATGRGKFADGAADLEGHQSLLASAARQHSPLSQSARAHRNRLQERRQQPYQYRGVIKQFNIIWDTDFGLDLTSATMKQILNALTKPQFKFVREDQLLLLDLEGDLKAVTRQPCTGDNELQDALIHIFHSSWNGRICMQKDCENADKVTATRDCDQTYSSSTNVKPSGPDQQEPHYLADKWKLHNLAKDEIDRNMRQHLDVPFIVIIQVFAHRFKNIKDSFQEHSKTVFVVEKDLRKFYGSKNPKVAKYRKDQGEKAEVGCAIGGMIKATPAQANMPNVEKRRALVVIGDGDFRDKNGGPVKSNKFITQLQSR
ncbi:hypothetical protein BGZ98_007100, partial [Dissophora globulifera]